jgi:hypothetical protein
MTASQSLFDDLSQALGEERMEVDGDHRCLDLSRGTGPMEATATLEPEPFLTSLEGLSDEQRRRRLASYVRGVQHVMLEPDDSDADQWDFAKAAGTLTMSLEVESFVDGCEATTGSPAWHRRFDEDLVFVFLLELDMGIRVLTVDQFERWSASPDRVLEGARSMLFHKAHSESPTDIDDYKGVEQLSVGDGFDAARCLVLDDLFFGEFDDSSRVAMPSPDDLLFVRNGTDDHVSELQRATADRFRETSYPLTDALFGFERSKPVRKSS